jgi:hypothetical protein
MYGSGVTEVNVGCIASLENVCTWFKQNIFSAKRIPLGLKNPRIK